MNLYDKLEIIKDSVLKYTEVSKNDFESECRLFDVARARQIYCYFADMERGHLKQSTVASLIRPSYTHSGVVHGRKIIRQEIGYNSHLKTMLTEIESKYKDKINEKKEEERMEFKAPIGRMRYNHMVLKKRIPSSSVKY